VVFTLPHRFGPLVKHNRNQLYDPLFRASAETLKTFGRNSPHLTAHLGANPDLSSPYSLPGSRRGTIERRPTLGGSPLAR
jgi:hypothetical protein